MCSVYNSSKVRWPRQSQSSEFSGGAGKHVAIAVAGLDFTAAWILSVIFWRLQSAVCKVSSRAPWCVLSLTYMVQNTLQKRKKRKKKLSASQSWFQKVFMRRKVSSVAMLYKPCIKLICAFINNILILLTLLLFITIITML